MKIIKDSECSKDTPLLRGHPECSIYGRGVAISPRVPGKNATAYEQKVYLPQLLPLEEYDIIIVLTSGGKDSAAAFYRLLELGVPKEKIELWHHDIDGGHPHRRMDWPVTQAYVRAFAEAEQVKLRMSARVNGFWGEVYRLGSAYPIEYEDEGEVKTCPLSKGQLESEQLRQGILDEMDPDTLEALKVYGCRMKFPAKSGDLARRWCSASLKIDVATSVLRNLEGLGKVQQFPLKGSIAMNRFCSPQLKREVGDSVIRNLESLKAQGGRQALPAKSGCHQGRWCSGSLKASIQGGVTATLAKTSENVKILVVSGERRGESANRAKYNEMEVHRTNATARAHRLVHHWRAVIDHTERDVWEILRRHRVTPHPCYTCGWSRCSCMMCIFSLPRHWAGIKELFPSEYDAVCQDEIRLGFTLDNKKTLPEYVGSAESCVHRGDKKALHQLVTGIFTPADIQCTGEWLFPAGAFGGAEGGPC